jgi:hypothetical protein
MTSVYETEAGTVVNLAINTSAEKEGEIENMSDGS